jgi:ribosome-binding protein aMBF1 (putative translation factor)
MKPLYFDEYLKDQLKDPKFKKIMDESEAEYQAGAALIRARIEKRLSQRQLAKKAKTTQAVISRIERMSVSPSVNLLQKLALAMGKRLEIRFA